MSISLKERLFHIFKFRKSFSICNALFYKDYLEETIFVSAAPEVIKLLYRAYL